MNSDGPVQNPDTPEQRWRRLEDEGDWWRQRAAKLEGEAEHLSLQLEDTKRESTCYRQHAEAALARAAEALRKAELERDEYRATCELLKQRVEGLQRECEQALRRERATLDSHKADTDSWRESLEKTLGGEPMQYTLDVLCVMLSDKVSALERELHALRKVALALARGEARSCPYCKDRVGGCASCEPLTFDEVLPDLYLARRQRDDAEQRFAASQAELRVVLEEKQATFDRLNAELIEEQRYGDDVRQGRDRALAEKGAAVEAEREACAQTVEHAARQQEARARRLRPSEADLRGLASAIRARGGKS